MDEMEPQDDGKRSMVKWAMNMPNRSVLGIFRDFDRVYGGGRQCVASSNLVLEISKMASFLHKMHTETMLYSTFLSCRFHWLCRS
ncbi:hypothetical protein HanLR1_Chr04g0152291 [Helianthus annuus]|uniref:Uncharacterized protein n=1 Tax=Helianthus annuus TaxID=4232 RepID=A0A251V1M6_HELAN|nr:hypothetical protein HanLR1_Chr04g0152291 [Helianthus annuus]